jgi:hypothetical protein
MPDLWTRKKKVTGLAEFLNFIRLLASGETEVEGDVGNYCHASLH